MRSQLTWTGDARRRAKDWSPTLEGGWEPGPPRRVVLCLIIEHGKRNPSVLTLVDRAAALDVAPGELINYLTEGSSAESAPQ